MPHYLIRWIDGHGLVSRKYGTNARDLDEANSHARCIARNTADVPHAGWTGWFVDVIEESGRSFLTLPVCMASEMPGRAQGSGRPTARPAAP